MIRLACIAAAALVILACGGGGASALLGANFFAPSIVAMVKATNPGTVTVDVGGTVDQDLAIPSAPPANPGDLVFAIPDGMLFADRAYLPAGSPTVRVVNLNTGMATSLGTTLNQLEGHVRFQKGLALPAGRWRLEFNGLMRFHAQTKSAAMDVKQIAYEFDVFNNGTASLPIEIYGDMPKNGKSISRVSISGKAQSANGVGQVQLVFAAAGQQDVVFTANKQPSQEIWTWLSQTGFACPTDGWDSITIKCDF